MKFIYFHIGKCGGLTIRYLFEEVNSIKSQICDTENSFENYCNELIKNKNLINELEYVEVHAGTSVSFYNSVNLIKHLKILYENKILVFITLRDPLETIISLYYHSYKYKAINRIDYKHFEENFNINYITNYLYSGNTNFGRFNTLPKSHYDKKNTKNIEDFFITKDKFQHLVHFLDYFVDYIVYIDEISNFFQLINKNYNIELKYINKIINRSNCKKYNINENEKNKLIKILDMDYYLYNRYKSKCEYKMYLGSCRINGGSEPTWRSKYFNTKESTEIAELFSYTNSTKDVIQLLKFINNEIDIPENELNKCFRSFYLNNNNINRYKEYRNYLFRKFKNIDVFILEICSRETYCDKEGYYYCWDHINGLKSKRSFNELNDLRKNIMTDKDILQDISFIRNYLNKPVLIISHIDCKSNNLAMGNKNELIKLLSNICEKNDISFYNPTQILEYYPQEKVVDKDLIHYNRYYHDIITRVINYNINDTTNT